MLTENIKIQDCDLSIYVKKIFKNAKINTIRDLLELDVNTLIKYRGFGSASVKEIIHFVNINGFTFN
jgi:DNA-directed RNA polymerase alpha subunit